MIDPSSPEVRTIERCFAGLAALDAHAVILNCTENSILELPYFKTDEARVVEGRATVHGDLKELLGPVRDPTLRRPS